MIIRRIDTWAGVWDAINAVHTMIRSMKDWMTNANVGILDNGGEVTLSASGGTTVVTRRAFQISYGVYLCPITPEAAAEVAAGGLYITPAAGSFTINHQPDEITNKTFRYVFFTGVR